jgi:hypothetical protein
MTAVILYLPVSARALAVRRVLVTRVILILARRAHRRSRHVTRHNGLGGTAWIIAVYYGGNCRRYSRGRGRCYQFLRIDWFHLCGERERERKRNGDREKDKINSGRILGVSAKLN